MLLWRRESLKCVSESFAVADASYVVREALALTRPWTVAQSSLVAEAKLASSLEWIR